MLPPELVQLILDHLDLISLVSLSQTCRAWNEAISEAEYQYMLIRNCPWYQLSNSNRVTWKSCVLEHLRRYSHKSAILDPAIIADLTRDTNVVTKTDEFLPKNFHALCKMTLTKDGWHDDVMLRTTDTGFVFEGEEVDLTNGGFEEEWRFEGGLLSTKYGLQMKPVTQHPVRIIAVKVSNKCTAAIVCYEPNEYRILFKNSDSSGFEPDIDFCMNSDEWLYSAGFTPSHLTSFDLFLVDSCVFVYTEQRGYIGALMALNNGVMERVFFNHDYVLTSSPKMLCAYDGKLAMAGKQVVPESMRFLFNRTAMHATCISQDCLVSGYVGLYNSLGGMTQLIDFSKGRIIDVTAFSYASFQPGHVAIPGLVSGELVIYRYSQQFLMTHFPHIDVQGMLSKLVWLVDAPEVKVLPNLTKAQPKRGQRQRQRRVVV